MTKRIVITGVSGFVGGSLVKYFSPFNFELIGISRTEPSQEVMSILKEWRQVDLSEMCPDLSCDTVIHCAGLANDTSSLEAFIKNNVTATESIYNGINFNQFIYISSASVYENLDGDLNEDRILGSNCVSRYAQSKLLAENFLLNQKDKRILILRPRAIYGKNDTVLLPKLFKLSISKSIQIVIGDGKFETSLTHFLNLAEAINLAIEKNSAGLYNICDPENYVLRNVLKDVHYFKTKHKVWQVSIPVNLIKAWVNVSEFLRLKSSINAQTLNYLTRPCVLNTNKMNKDLPLSKYQTFSLEAL